MGKKETPKIKNVPKADSIWDYSKNTLDSATISVNSHKYAFFICPQCNGSWFGIIRDSIRHGVCPACNKKNNISSRRLKGIESGKSLHDLFPTIASEWVIDINSKLDLYPESVSAYSGHIVSWKCPKCLNIYEASIASRTRMHSNCPYCSGHRISVGYNDFASQRADLLKEWDFEQNQNEGLFPNQVTCGSKKMANWICPLGHRYKRSIKDRTSGRNCSVCGKSSQTSFPEQAIFFYVKKYFVAAENRYLFDGKTEVDIFIPELNIGIEYDGFFHHMAKKQESDKRKTEYLFSRGIRLIRIIEDEDALFSYCDDIIITPIDSTYNYLNKVIETLFRLIGVTCSAINVRDDISNIYAQYIAVQKKSSIIQNIELMKEWDNQRNGLMKPEAIPQNSNRPVFWICKKGHSYLASPKHRNSGTSCPYCSGKKVLAGFNDFKHYCELHPNVLLNWDFDSNPKNLSEIYYSSTKLFNWICTKCGRKYQKSIRNTIRGEGCPYCNHKLVAPEKSFGTLHPEALLDWDYEKNTINPYLIMEFSNKSVYWKCHICGNTTYATINSRAHGFHCTKCAVSTIKEKSRQTRILHRGSLATNKPLLLSEWDYQRNTDIRPEEVTEGSGKTVWWSCSQCHAIWEDTINSRSHGKKCPSCGYTPYPRVRKK